MMRILFLILSLWACGAKAADSFIVLSYHDVRDSFAENESQGQTVVTTGNLKAQFGWLRSQGYRVVSVQDLVEAKAGKRVLPDKAVLLTFDDGYISFYEKVFPLLKEFRYPATIALVGSWMNVPPGGAVPYSENEAWVRERFLSWAQVKEMVSSGLVEVASHSYDSHHGIVGNPRGNLQPAAVTRRYDDRLKGYEDDAAYARRIGEEMQRSARDIESHLGVRPRVIAWPYGEYNRPLIVAALAAGMTVTMGLDDGRNSIHDLSAVKRILVAENPSLQEFANIVTDLRADRPLRVAHVDLDYVFDPDSDQTERNLGAIVSRLKEMGVTTVYLQAYADPDGDGNADALYFPNRHLPVRADLFNRAAWQLRTRAEVKVYAWMPVLAFRVDAPTDWWVQEWRDGKPQLSSHIYRRLSPFHSEARRIVAEIYEDLGKLASFNGLLFHDDAILSDFEDVSPNGLADLGKLRDLPADFTRLHASANARLRWGRHKTEALAAFTDLLADRVRQFRPTIKTARNIYALPLLEPHSEEWFAQSFPVLLKHYDYLALEAMPLMERAENPEAWLTDVIRTVTKHQDGLEKTVFELQAVDWSRQQDLPMAFFLKQVKLIQSLGAKHIGYYPDNVFHDHPRLAELRTAFAVPNVP
jgi:biofilm PGA synthesis lipoprotein PgaB